MSDYLVCGIPPIVYQNNKNPVSLLETGRDVNGQLTIKKIKLI